MLYQGIIGGGSSPVEDLSPVLLWTNPSPTSPFKGQTVELNLTEYAGVIIESNFTVENATLASRVYYKVGETASSNTVLGMGTHNTEANGCSARSVLVTSTGISFGTPYFGAGVVSQNDLIPTKIYGVKKYVVEPVQPNNVINLGTGTSFNISTLVPNVDYTKLTADNFIVGCNNSSSTTRENKSPGNVGNEYITANISSITKNYDNSTGILSLSGGILSVTGSGVLSVYNKNVQLPIFAYLVTGNIVNI